VGAVSALERAVSPIDGRPDFSESWLELASSLMQVPGRTADALSAYRHAQELLEGELKVNPDDARNLAALAMVHAKLGNLSQVDVLVSRALALAPTDKKVHYWAAMASAPVSKKTVELGGVANTK
jgi:Flp pilus assembly protein TadD